MSVIVDSLAFRYPTAAAGLDGVSLGVAPGEFCAVIGPSGCGKSTLLKLIAGFLSPAAGRIHIAGADMTGVPPRLRNLGIVFQNYALFPHMTALENVAYPLKLRGVGRAERLRRAGQALERTRLAGLADRHPRQLSGGQQQRVALARALVFAPGALLLDEPLSALDAAHRAAMRDEIRAVQREHGIATLHVTHDQEEALSIADKVAVMRDGALLQLASPQELYDRPADRFVAGFVGHANLFDGRVRGADLVETAIGPLACATEGRAVGTSVTLLARPEAIRIDPPDDAVNRFAGTLVRDRFLGSLRRYDLAVPGGTILGETLSRADIRSVQIPPECLRILPA
ncbi:iron(III) transport system ATP-binding protein (plasmid) [Azospirillum sp. B510]|uniref:ABC transporter ATP-binding protein n=1 Tax=Azospirillum sp. (strain B510) TaxID=137722 RepID=UPI0001C4BCE2|nr:ABC transporter ATP-binding protein [Azospirillum sp. B510]BAI74557.1 iron(III) transport system ATP-binding protein [Azospirillum sp. B510]